MLLEYGVVKNTVSFKVIGKFVWFFDTHDDVVWLVDWLINKVVASEGMVEMQAEVLELLQSVDTKLDYRSFLAATMEKVSTCSVVDTALE